MWQHWPLITDATFLFLQLCSVGGVTPLYVCGTQISEEYSDLSNATQLALVEPAF